MFKWDQCLLYTIRMTLYMTILFQTIQYLIEHNIGFYELFFSKDVLYDTLYSLFFWFIFSIIQYYYKYKNKKL
ncbi:hypothetical protein RiCNE_07620 [Rickettsia endosymbiont of Culicoides newsteadi]|nr:hypothetical protein RiCNE_07620 [Rickettsia endosymbiont of Culicoides newsteadi]